MPNYRYAAPEYMRRGNMYSNSCQPERNIPAQTAQTAVSCAPTVNSNANCNSNHNPLSGLAIAMAYVPWQEWCSICSVEKGFHQGTIFEELNKPFLGMGGCS